MKLDKKVEWDSSMSVGEKNIDAQHKKLIGQINRLIDVISSLSVEIGHVHQSGQFLYDYIKEHFAYEEKYMEEHNFPGLEKHKEIHQDFIQFYKNFKAELKEEMSSGDFSSVEVEKILEKIKKYLMDWFVNHIKGMDQEYAEYIRAH